MKNAFKYCFTSFKPMCFILPRHVLIPSFNQFLHTLRLLRSLIAPLQYSMCILSVLRMIWIILSNSYILIVIWVFRTRALPPTRAFYVWRALQVLMMTVLVWRRRLPRDAYWLTAVTEWMSHKTEAWMSHLNERRLLRWFTSLGGAQVHSAPEGRRR